MGFYIPNVSDESLKDSGFAGISKSGIYDAVIKFVSVKTNDFGARSLDFNLLVNNIETTLYGLKLDDNSGKEHFQRNLFDKLCVIAGLEEVNEPVIQTHIVGKDKVAQDFSVLEDFSDLPIKVRVQYIYSLYNDEIREQREIKAFYRSEDGATANEIVHGLNPGTQLAKDEVRASDSNYKNGLTMEAVEAWKASKRDGNQAPKVTPAKKASTKNPFAGK